MKFLFSKYTLAAKNPGYTFIPALLGLILIFMDSCSQNDLPDYFDDLDGFVIKVEAGIAEELSSRAPGDDIVSGMVTDGEYYISYPAAKPEAGQDYVLGTVQFGTDDSNPEMGIVSIPSGNPFKWKEIYSGTPTFYLDNVASTDIPGDGANSVVYFNDTYNPYIAAFYVPSSNDLLWGSKQVSHGSTSTLNFDLHHNMARVIVEITVDKTNDAQNGDLDLEGATVEITNINTVPLSFNRLDGTLALNPDATLESVVFTDNEHTMTETPLSPEDDNKVFVYTTQSCVLPPQGLLENELRPRLVITLKNGTRYSGILPTAMDIENPDGTNPLPAALYFLKEHILTIRTVITEEPPSLMFMPVKVVEWVDKGNFSLEGHQSGIYTANELISLIGYYNANNIYQLERYGKIVTPENGNPTWVFDVFRSFSINYIDIYKKINKTDQLDFSFNFNNYSVTVKNNDKQESVSQNDLKLILKGEKELFNEL